MTTTTNLVPESDKSERPSIAGQAKESSKLSSRARLLTLKFDDNLESAVHRMRHHDVRAAVVIDSKGKLLGMVTEKEIYKHLMYKSRNSFEQPRIASYKNFYVWDAMIRDPLCLHAHMTPEEALAEMKRHNFQFMPLIDNGQVQGVIDMKDLMLDVNDSAQKRSSEKETKKPFLSDFLKRRGSTIKILAKPANRV